MKKKLSRLMIAAPRSGSGKTIFTCGLLNLLKDRNVASFKCGPDYIDPMFHRTVIGLPSENLDSFFCKDGELLEILGGRECDYGVLEGVMGIYDGIGGGSGYEIATITRTPILLVMDGSGIWNTILSLIKGIVMDDSQNLIKAIVLNKVTPNYYDTIASMANEMLEKMGSDARVIGFVPNKKDLSLDSRHLGLKMPSEIDDLKKRIDGFTNLIEEHCNVEEILRIMDAAEDIEVLDILEEGMNASTDDPSEKPLRIAVARDEAFCFYYEDNFRLLKNHGIEPVEFSPIKDKALPEGVSGLLLGGGYPELYAQELQGNQEMRESIKRAIESGMPSLAECGGFMYLLEGIYGDDEEVINMAGVIKGTSKNTGKLGRFGYINITAENDGGILPKGSSIRGHEFHYYDSTNNGEACLAEKPDGKKTWRCLHNGENHLWGYPHLFYRSNSELIVRLKKSMEEYGKRDG